MYGEQAQLNARRTMANHGVVRIQRKPDWDCDYRETLTARPTVAGSASKGAKRASTSPRCAVHSSVTYTTSPAAKTTSVRFPLAIVRKLARYA